MGSPYDYQNIIFDEMFNEHKSFNDDSLDDEIEMDEDVDECEEDNYDDEDCE